MAAGSAEAISEMNPGLALWLGSGALAVLMLMNMMRRRQLHLIGLLKDYVERQAQWARRRAKADELAVQAEAKKNKEAAG